MCHLHLQLPLPLAVLQDCINLIAAYGTNTFAPYAFSAFMLPLKVMLRRINYQQNQRARQTAAQQQEEGLRP